MASDSVVVSDEHHDQPNPLRRKPPVPVPKEALSDNLSPVFSQLVDELGDPLDHNDKSYDDFRTASQMWIEAHQALHNLTQEPTDEEVPGN